MTLVRSRPLLWALSALLAAGAPAARAADVPDALGFEPALRLAAARSGALRAQDHAAAAARELGAAAGRLPDPTLKAGIANLPIDGADRYSLTRDFMTMRSIGLMQELTHPDKRRARAARYEREAELARATRSMLLAELRRETAAAWLGRYYAERVQQALRDQREEAGLEVEAADAAHRGGRGSLAEAVAARAAAAALDDRLREAGIEIEAARSKLERWVGAAAAQPLAAAPDLARLRADADAPAGAERHPGVAVLLAQEAAARAEADLALSERHADWSVELMFSQRGSAYSNMVSLSVSVPLQWDRAQRQQRELAARLALAEQRHAEVEEARRERAAQWGGTLRVWRLSRERLAQFDAALIPLAAERTRAALAGYRGGSTPLATVLEARRGEVELRVERWRLEAQAAALWVQLEFLLPPDDDAERAYAHQETAR